MKKSIILASAALLGLSFVGCAAQPDGGEMPVICGGVTDCTDADMPKEIQSKNIVDFATVFFIRDQYDATKGGRYSIKIGDNELGEHMLRVSGVYEHELKVSDRVLEDVQAIIDKYKLVKQNSGGRVTAGLPAEWGPWMLSVTYLSGEKLYFYENGAPEADWTAAFRDYFVNLMAEAGFEDVLPPKEAMTIRRFSFAFDLEGEYRFYGLAESEGASYLLHHALDPDTQERKTEDFAIVTDELFEGLQTLILATGMDALHAPESVHFDLQGSREGFLEIYIDYVSGRQIYGEYEAAELPAGWPEMKAALVEFLDAYIRDHPAAIG